ncbi:MAG: alanine racemase [Pseudomonadota bacterium]
MSTAALHIDLDALAANWRALDARSSGDTRTAAVVKADGYGLDAGIVARKLATIGAETFFVAVAKEGAVIRKALGPGPEIAVFGGHMAGDTTLIADHDLIPMLNAPEQARRHLDALPGRPYGVQLNSGMNRLGFQANDWAALRTDLTAPWLIMSHLACADEPAHAQNAAQLAAFRAMTDGLGAPRSFSATGGILLGPDYHFDMTRPGIGLYGGLPFAEAAPVVRLTTPVIQCRDVEPGESVGYGASWTATRPSRIATTSAGYADGLIRAMSNRAVLWAGDTPCPLAGRVSMDLLTVDITDLDTDPDALDILGPHQGVDALAEAAGTIGYEILTSLGARYDRHYTGTTA